MRGPLALATGLAALAVGLRAVEGRSTGEALVAVGLLGAALLLGATVRRVR